MPLDTLEKGINIKNLSLDLPAKPAEKDFAKEMGIKEEHWKALTDRLETLFSRAETKPDDWIKVIWILPSLKTFAGSNLDINGFTERINWEQTFEALQKRPNGSDWDGFVRAASYIELLKPHNPKVAEMAQKYKQECIGNFEFLKENNIEPHVGNVARGLWILYPDMRDPLQKDQVLFDLVRRTVDESERDSSWESCVRNAATLKIMHPEKPRSNLLSDTAFQKSYDQFQQGLNLIKYWNDDQALIHSSLFGSSLKILSSNTVKIGPNGFEFTNSKPQLPLLASPQPQTRKF